MVPDSAPFPRCRRKGWSTRIARPSAAPDVPASTQTPPYGNGHECARRCVGGRGRQLPVGVSLALLLATAGCVAPTSGFPERITNLAPRVLNLWRGSVIAALAVGVTV